MKAFARPAAPSNAEPPAPAPLSASVARCVHAFCAIIATFAEGVETRDARVGSGVWTANEAAAAATETSKVATRTAIRAQIC